MRLLNIHRIVILLIFAVISVSATGSKNETVIGKLTRPDYINLQYAGNLGLGSVGLGYMSDNQKHHLGINYGYLPSFVNSTKVHTFSLKSGFHFKKKKLSEKAFFNPYFGTHLLYSVTDNTYLKFPSYYPTDYYYTNAFHLAPFVGLKVGSRKSITRFSYVEIGSLDSYLINWIKYKRSKFADCINVCMGISIPINNSLQQVLVD